jgi:NitT/TauT family transport system permease protein
MKRAIVAIIFFAALVGIWQIAVVSGRWSPVLLPPPLSVLEYLWSAVRDGSLLDSSLVTLRRLAEGYVIGVALAPLYQLAS